MDMSIIAVYVLSSNLADLCRVEAMLVHSPSFVVQRRRGLVVKLHCGHMFCEGCIDEWLRREHTCPLCRAPIDDVIRVYE